MTIALPLQRPPTDEPDPPGRPDAPAALGAPVAAPEPGSALTAATGSALECARALLALHEQRRCGLDPCQDSVREVLATARALVLELTMALRDGPTMPLRKSSG